MKSIFTILLLIGLFTLAVSGIAYARAAANTASIICELAELRTESNIDEMMKLETMVSSKLKMVKRPYVTISWLAGSCSVLSIIGLFMPTAKKSANKAFEGNSSR